jgi:hypothetical protein
MQNIISSHLSATDFSYIDKSYKNSAYDDDLRILLIHFHTNSSVYAYNNISANTYKQLLQAPSQGRFFWQHIRRDKLRYPFVLVAKNAPIITQKHFETAFAMFNIKKKEGTKARESKENSALFDVYPDLKKLDKFDKLEKRLSEELERGKIDANAYGLAIEKIDLDKQKSIDKLESLGYFDNELNEEQKPRILWWMFKSVLFLLLFGLGVAAFCFFVYYLLPFVVFGLLGGVILLFGAACCR